MRGSSSQLLPFAKKYTHFGGEITDTDSDWGGELISDNIFLYVLDIMKFHIQKNKIKLFIFIGRLFPAALFKRQSSKFYNNQGNLKK